MWVVGLENDMYVGIVGGYKYVPKRVFEMYYPVDAEVFFSKQDAYSIVKAINNGEIKSKRKATCIQRLDFKATSDIEWIK